MNDCTLAEFLDGEWRPALGCTEPASIAYAASLAAREAGGTVERVSVICDPRMYKNCFAVGIPNSGHKTGLLWAIGLGALLPDPEVRLEVLRQVTPDILERAGRLIEDGRVYADVEPARMGLYVDCHVESDRGSGRVTIEGEHTRVTRIERDGVMVAGDPAPGPGHPSVRERFAEMSFSDMMDMADGADAGCRTRLRQGVELNMGIARHGMSLLPGPFVGETTASAEALAGKLVCAGVYARMWGADMPVMSLAGSGNKGISVSVPLALRSERSGVSPERADQALALACMVTSATTHHLGTLSAVCGCSNAAGVGLAAGLVYLDGGDAERVSMAVTNMVGNVAGMICDGAKIGCALKTMSGVDAAFRAASLAMNGVTIPHTDGIVGTDGLASLRNLGRIAVQGMAAVDSEVLDILRAKMHEADDERP
jgi:L-cysteine desulfidase